MYISNSPRPNLSPAAPEPDNPIDELLAGYRINKQQQKADPAEELISWIRDNADDDLLRQTLSEQPESLRADLYERLMTVYIEENIDDEQVRDMLRRAWRKVPPRDQAPVLLKVTSKLDAKKLEHAHLWQWVWSSAKCVEPLDNRGQLLLDVASKLILNENYSLLRKILDSEIKSIVDSGRYFEPERDALHCSRIGTSFWRDIVGMLKGIPKQDTFLLPLLSCTGTLLNELEVKDPVSWEEFKNILLSTGEPNSSYIESFIRIGARSIQDPKFWIWIIDFIPALGPDRQYKVASEVTSCMGGNVKDSAAWTRMLATLSYMPPDSKESSKYSDLLGKIILYMGSSRVSDPGLWNAVMDKISVDGSSWNSRTYCGLEELTSEMYKVKITSPDLSFRLIKLHATALFKHLKEHAVESYAGIIGQIEKCSDVAALLNLLLNQALPPAEKKQLLERVSRSMGHAIHDTALWNLVINQQVQDICAWAPCADFIALKHYVTDLLKLYESSGKTFQLMMQGAIQSGRWHLSDFEQVLQYRKEVLEAAPDFPWDKLFNLDKQLGRKEFCTFPELAASSLAFVESIHDFALLVKKLPADQRPPFNPIAMLNGTLATQLHSESSHKRPRGMNREGLAYLVKVREGQAFVHSPVADAMKHLGSVAIKNDELKAAGDKAQECYRDLVRLAGMDDFVNRYDYCDFYTCEVLDKEAASALVLGNAVSCCLATDGESFLPEMINRLTHPSWVPVVVRDRKQGYVAVAWSAIAYDEETRQILLVEDFADIAPRFSQKEIVRGNEIENRAGNQIMKTLHKYLHELATDLQLEAKPLIGQQARGRMEKFDVFAKDTKACFSKPKLKFLCNENSTGDNIQHRGVVGQFF